MAKNDFHAVACILLMYLYECLKNSRKVNIDYIDNEHLNIGREYWEMIVTELFNAGYIEGVIVTSWKGGSSVLLTDKLRITMKGIEYLETDTAMEKARKALSEMKGWVSEIAALLQITSFI